MSRPVLLLVAVGGAAGAVVRYLVTGAISTNGSLVDPGVLAVNTSGCLLLGLALATASARPNIATLLRAGVGAGFCGGLTTFSTLAVRLAQQLQDAAYAGLLLEIAISIVFGAFAIVAGRALGGWLTPPAPS